MKQSTAVMRTEKKYRIPWQQKQPFLSHLATIMQADTHGGSDGYVVRSLYFDSMADEDYFDNINGLAVRKKIRLRVYGDYLEHVKLEVKRKQGNIQQKKSVWISEKLAKEMMQGVYGGLLALEVDFSDWLYQEMLTKGYRPVCMVAYRRHAFTEQSNHTRITIDTGIKTSARYDAFFEKDALFLPIGNQPILEVKYNGFLLSHIKQMLLCIDAPQTAISKYRMARQILGR